MFERLRRFLTRIAGDDKGGISEARLEEWLCRMDRRPVQLDDSHTYQIVRSRGADGRNMFRLEKVK
jgi:hypothetical protein